MTSTSWWWRAGGRSNRHWQFFDALSRMRPDLRVTLIGQRDGAHDISSARALAQRLRAPQNIGFYQSLPIDQVTRHQCRAKVSLIFSRRESCRVAVTPSWRPHPEAGSLRPAYARLHQRYPNVFPNDLMDQSWR